MNLIITVSGARAEGKTRLIQDLIAGLDRDKYELLQTSEIRESPTGASAETVYFTVKRK